MSTSVHHDDDAATVHHHATAPAQEHGRLGRRARLLAAVSVAYNSVEAVIAIAAGTIAGSGALVAFGLDSVIEVSSGSFCGSSGTWFPPPGNRVRCG